MNTRKPQHPVLDRTYRLVAAVLAALFLATGAADAYGLHRCPHHDGVPGVVSAGAHGAKDAHAGPAHGQENPGAASSHDTGPAAAAGVHAQPADSHGDHEEHGPCSCIGTCGVAGAALPVRGSEALRFEASEWSAGGAVSYRRAPTIDRDYLLPYANAPPPAR